MNKLMKRPYVNPVCMIVPIAMQSPCLLTGSFSVENMTPEEEQTVGGDEE